jgi:hypothetical protein
MHRVVVCTVCLDFVLLWRPCFDQGPLPPLSLFPLLTYFVQAHQHGAQAKEPSAGNNVYCIRCERSVNSV